MRLNRHCLKKTWLAAIGLSAVLSSHGTNAVTLNFSASIMQGTCSLNLDKSVLPLGSVSQFGLVNGVLSNLQPFTLTADNCIGVAGGGQQPGVIVLGAGSLQDGKWLFRSSDSDVGGAGVMVVQSATVPNYASSEVQNGTFFPLAGVGLAPVNQQLPFYAGVSCGGSSGCATVKAGTLTASLMFVFAYR
ncbi:fimbrial protein [Serratia fonticola]|uniref:fimbrial protein n=1 Tax=Serratia fonticola TaxID=47917 RepID=UPI0004658B2C|nr:type 1 fimbrial protein [Serratia fonticola]